MSILLKLSHSSTFVMENVEGGTSSPEKIKRSKYQAQIFSCTWNILNGILTLKEKNKNPINKTKP